MAPSLHNYGGDHMGIPPRDLVQPQLPSAVAVPKFHIISVPERALQITTKSKKQAARVSQLLGVRLYHFFMVPWVWATSNLQHRNINRNQIFHIGLQLTGGGGGTLCTSTTQKLQHIFPSIKQIAS